MDYSILYIIHPECIMVLLCNMTGSHIRMSHPWFIWASRGLEWSMRVYVKLPLDGTKHVLESLIFLKLCSTKNAAS